MDEDLQQLMLRFLEIEKLAVCDELEEYRTALVVVMTPEGRYMEQVSFLGEEEKIAAYDGIVKNAKANGATVIITINAARTRKVAPGEDMEGYYWGKLAAEGARDCISITASGPGMRSIGLDLAYDLVDGNVRFDPSADFEFTEIGLLSDWPGTDLQTIN